MIRRRAAAAGPDDCGLARSTLTLHDGRLTRLKPVGRRLADVEIREPIARLSRRAAPKRAGGVRGAARARKPRDTAPRMR
jgi:hypothetical protein